MPKTAVTRDSIPTKICVKGVPLWTAGVSATCTFRAGNGDLNVFGRMGLIGMHAYCVVASKIHCILSVGSHPKGGIIAVFALFQHSGLSSIIVGGMMNHVSTTIVALPNE
jgi:hypothetical protein